MIRKLKLLFIVIVGSLSYHATAAEAIEFSGFMRVIGGYLDESHAQFKGYKNELALSPASLVGLQLDYAPSNTLSVTGQAVARAQGPDLNLEWLYFTYLPNEAITLKAGKLRTPFFSLSDYTEVGYAYPWITPPQQVYNAYLFRTFEGVDLSYGFAGNNYDASLEVYIGQHDGESQIGSNASETTVGEIDFSVRNMIGIIGKLNLGSIELRASRYGGDVDLSIPEATTLAETLAAFGFAKSADSLQTKGNVTVSQLGIIYEELDYFVRAEWVKIESDLQISPKVESYYATLGYKISDFTTHLTYADSQALFDDPPNELPSFEGVPTELLSPQQLGVSQLASGYTQIFDAISRDDLQSWTLGLRWDVKPCIALKAEYSRLNGEIGQTSFFTDIDDEAFDRQSELYQIGMEWVF